MAGLACLDGAVSVVGQFVNYDATLWSEREAAMTAKGARFNRVEKQRNATSGRKANTGLSDARVLDRS